MPAKLITIIVGISLLAGLRASADQWFWPQPFDRTSPDGRWQASFTRGEEGPVVRILDRRSGVASVLELHNETFPVDAAMLDGGELLVFDEWHAMGHGDDVVVCYARQPEGERWVERWRRSLEDLLGERGAWSVPTSVSSRWWRKMPLEWELLEDRHGTWVSVTLHDENRVDLHLAHGVPAWREVKDVGLDPDRLIRRAIGLAEDRDFEAAAAELDKVWPGPESSLDPKLVPRLAYALRRAERAERAIELLEPLVTRTPPGSKDSDPQARHQRSLWLELANSYTAAGRAGDAEEAWRAMAVGEFDPWRWVVQVVQVQFRHGEEKQALKELYFYYRDMQAKGRDAMFMQRAAGKVGSMMLQRGFPEKAIFYLAHAWNPESIDFHRGKDYARALEATGDPEKAIGIWRALLADLGEDPLYSSYRKIVNDALDRLTEEPNPDPPDPG